MQGHLVLLNQASTLYKLRTQVFQPILVEGCAICSHPSIFGGFNANFERNQMVFHVHLSLEASLRISFTHVF